jgi:hypothetical protein
MSTPDSPGQQPHRKRERRRRSRERRYAARGGWLHCRWCTATFDDFGHRTRHEEIHR